MASYNRVVLMGNLTKDPELRYGASSNVPVARSGIAVNSRSKDREEVMFIDFVIFNKPAETLHQYCKKGSPILIEGKLKLDTWEKEGKRQSKHEIVVDNFQLLPRRDREEGGEFGGGSSQAAKPAPAPSDSFDKDDDDIPF